MEKYYIDMITGRRHEERPDATALDSGVGAITVCPVIVIEDDKLSIECADDKDIKSININAILNDIVSLKIESVQQAVDKMVEFLKGISTCLAPKGEVTVVDKDICISMVIEDYSSCPFIDSEGVLSELYSILNRTVVRVH